MTASVTAVLLAYGAEQWLEQAVTAVLGSRGIDIDVVVVDNGCISDAVAHVKGLTGVRVITPDTNLGYAGGCVRGGAEAKGNYLAFVNSDAIVAPDALARLVAVAAEADVGFAMGSIRLADSPELINSAGNPLHFVGLSWAGGFNEPAARHAERRSVIAGSGCCFVMRTDLWEDLGGFADEYFAYAEDTELSLRLWQRGRTVEYVPDAVVLHHYQFSRNERKFYLLERNRAIMLLTTYQGRSLLVLAPMLLLTEVLMLGAAIAGGWGAAKVRGWRWLWQHRGWIRARRSLIQRERVIPDSVIFQRITARFDPANIAAPPGVSAFNAIMSGYWRVACKLL
ncbi:MAG TPA: glycosyltransferase family 2 protein [Streptosporangiaceae bacterium]|nr:glycosyltransferase family 2 protein [Streptosporangiaceae bacterium]